MTSPQTLVPEIRFEGFSSAWNRCSVGDVASVLGGNAWKSSEYADDGDYLVVTIANVSGDVYIDDTIGNHISCESPNGYLLHGEDILVSLTGDVGRVSKMSNTRGLLNQRVGKVIPNQSKITPDYLFHVLRNPIFEKAMIEAGQGAAQKNISNKDILAYSLAAPSEVKEQIDVANFLNSIDCLINLYQRKYDRLKNVKKSMLEKMFPRDGANVPEIRFAGFTDAWEQRKFSDFAQRESTFRESSSEYPSVEYEDVVAEEGRLNKDVRQKEVQKTGIVFDGSQVLYGKLRPYLHNWLSPDFTGVAVGDWWVLRPVGVDKKFLYRLIQTQQFDEVANQSSGSKMPRADWNLVSNTEFILPSSVDEQRQIAETFDNLDTLITLHQRQD